MDIAYLVGNPGSIAATDAAQITMLEDAGHVVTPIDDSNVSEEDPVDYDVAVLGVSAGELDSNTLYKSWPKGVVICRIGSCDDRDLSTGSGSGSSGLDEWEILNEDHALAAGFPNGNVTIVTSTVVLTGMPTAQLGPDVIHIAAREGNSDSIALFAYEAGGIGLNSFVMPARRVALFAQRPDLATADLETLIVNAVEWAGADVILLEETEFGIELAEPLDQVIELDPIEFGFDVIDITPEIEAPNISLPAIEFGFEVLQVDSPFQIVLDPIEFGFAPLPLGGDVGSGKAAHRRKGAAILGKLGVLPWPGAD